MRSWQGIPVVNILPGVRSASWCVPEPLVLSTMCTLTQQFGLPPSRTWNTHVLPLRAVALQWMLVLASINVSWPAVLSGPFSAVAWFFALSSTSTGLDCLLSRTNHDRLVLPMLKTLVGVCMPVALLAVLLCVDVASLKARQLVWKRNRARARRFNAAYPTLQTGVLARTAIVVVFFFLPSLLRTVYGMFACVQLDAAPPSQHQSGPSYIVLNAVGSYWLLDTNQLCFQGYHRVWALGLGLPLLLLLCVGVPFGIIAYLYIRRQRLAYPYYLQHYGFLYASYQPNRFYWEGVMALQVWILAMPLPWISEDCNQPVWDSCHVFEKCAVTTPLQVRQRVTVEQAL